MSTAMTFPGQHSLSGTKGGIDAIIAFFDAVDAISGHLQRARSRQASTWRPTRTGKSLDELRAVLQQSGLTKHSEIRAMFQRDLGLGYGDANMLAQVLRKTGTEGSNAAQAETPDDVVNALYTGAKADLRPIHDRLMAEITQLGTFEIAPKKGYLSLRRKKQFAMIGPATNTRVEVGLNMKGVDATTRLTEMPSGGMCNYKVKVTDVAEVDAELIAWIKRAYESAG